MSELDFEYLPSRNTLVHQVERPHGEPRREHFRFVRQPLAPLAPGEALVRNMHFSVDPYMRECMDGDWALHAPLEGRTIGRVLRSTDTALRPGDWVFHRQGWRTYAQVPVQALRVIRPAEGVPITAWLSILGGTGLTAWVALTRIVRLQPGESVYVSAAAGGVGTAAGQFAKLLGAGRIVGSTSNESKARQLMHGLGYSDAFVYRPGQVAAQLRERVPEGVDVYLDNVGGEQLEAAIAVLKDHGRAALIGAVAQYSALQPPRRAAQSVRRGGQEPDAAGLSREELRQPAAGTRGIRDPAPPAPRPRCARNRHDRLRQHRRRVSRDALGRQSRQGHCQRR